MSAVVRNTGVVPAGPFAVRFFVGDPDRRGHPDRSRHRSHGLGPESATTASVTWSPVNARGSLGLFVVADPAGQVEESDESDNRAFRPFQATGLPDLVLTAADVVLEPGYPRGGEEVTIRATVRNLGGQPSAATSLRAVEGEPAAGTVVGVPFRAGARAGRLRHRCHCRGRRRRRRASGRSSSTSTRKGLSSSRTRATTCRGGRSSCRTPTCTSPSRTSRPTATESKDETTLAWRATGRVGVVVSNSRGRVVKTLVTDGPESGSVRWDGRDERGVVAWDGGYTVTLTGEGGQVLGRALVDLDTNRSPIHDASGPAETSVRNLTCSLPTSLLGPAWMPSEDEALFVVAVAQPGFPVGLLRAGLDGGYSYVMQDEWYGMATFATAAAVSPDGREVLIGGAGELFAVDLATGSRRSLGDGLRTPSWSPDGRFILLGDTVLARDGSVVADLCESAPCGAGWAWSPSSDRLASGSADGGGDSWLAQITIVARDGTVLDHIPVPWGAGRTFQYVYPGEPVWRGDGKIVTRHAYVVRDDYESYDIALWSIPTRAARSACHSILGTAPGRRTAAGSWTWTAGCGSRTGPRSAS